MNGLQQRKRIFRVLLLFVLFLSTGCQFQRTLSPTDQPLQPSLSVQKPNFRGTVKTIYFSGTKVNGFYAEGISHTDMMYNKARILINDLTTIFTYRNGIYSLSNIDEIKVGVDVYVLFVGAIEESDPIRATAGEIQILK